MSPLIFCLPSKQTSFWETSVETAINVRNPVLVEKSAQRRRCKHCVLAVVRRSQNFLPRRRPPSRGVRDGQNLISWRWSLNLPTNPVWWRSMHTISSYRGNRPTHTHKHTPTDRQDRLQYTALQLACSVITSVIRSSWRLYLSKSKSSSGKNYSSKSKNTCGNNSIFQVKSKSICVRPCVGIHLYCIYHIFIVITRNLYL